MVSEGEAKRRAIKDGLAEVVELITRPPMTDFRKAQLRAIAKKFKSTGAELYECGMDASTMMLLVEAGELVNAMVERGSEE